MSPIRISCAVISLFLLILLSACTPKSPEQRVAELRAGYVVEVNPSGFVAEANLPEPMIDEMSAEDTSGEDAGETAAEEMTSEDAGEIDAGEVMDEGAQEVQPESYDIVLDLLIKNGNSEVLPQLTVDIIHTDSAQVEKERWPVTFDTSNLLSGTSSQISHRLVGVDFQDGDMFTAEIRAPITAAEYGDYPEFGTAP